MSYRLMPLAAAVLLLTPMSAAVSAAETNLLVDPGFEEAFTALEGGAKGADGKPKVTGSMADNWSDNSDWADLKVNYSQETNSHHGGKASMHINATVINSGAVQFVQHLDFLQGHTYSCSVWMRGTPDATVEIVLRQRDQPYMTFTSTAANLTDKWVKTTMSGAVSAEGPGFLMFRVTAAAEVFIDDVSLTDVTKAK